jgi:hypothetical protein
MNAITNKKPQSQTFRRQVFVWFVIYLIRLSVAENCRMINKYICEKNMGGMGHGLI